MKSSPAISVCIFLFKIDEIENGDLAWFRVNVEVA
jgi:hypothetical protein